MAAQRHPSGRVDVGVHLVLPVGLAGNAAAMAEAVGCDSVWTSDHLIWPAHGVEGYPYADDGQPPVGPTTPFFDPWVLLASIAAVTSTVRLGTYVYVLPLRHPLVTARAVATLDTLSDGRAILGAGMGWLRAEFEAGGQSFDDRGSRGEEIIEVLRRLWSEPSVAFTGSTITMDAVHLEPKPPQGAQLPILLGGESPAALRRAASLGDGWIGMPHTPATAAQRVGELRALRSRSDRAALPFEITVGATAPITASLLRDFEEAGVDRVVVRPWRRSSQWEAGLAALGDALRTYRGGG